MIIQNNFQKKINSKKDDNTTVAIFFLGLLTFTLMILVVFNLIELIELLKNLKEVNNAIDTLKELSEHYEIQKELKISYIWAIVKQVCVVLAEISIIVVSGYIANKLRNLKNEKKNSEENE